MRSPSAPGPERLSRSRSAEGLPICAAALRAARQPARNPARRSDGLQPHLVNIQFQRRVAVMARAPGYPSQRLHQSAPKVPRRRTAEARAARSPFLQEIALFCDFKQDESYTPRLVSIRAGNSLHDARARRPAPRPARLPRPGP